MSMQYRIAIALLLLAIAIQPMFPLLPSSSGADRTRAVADPDTGMVHLELLGPDQDRIPEGYVGVVPEKVVAELNIPKEYLRLEGSRAGPFVVPPLTTQTSNVPIEVFYPSMRGATEREVSEIRIRGIIKWADESRMRNGVRSTYLRDGVTRESDLDVSDVCGFIDAIHVGYAGTQFYVACNDTQRTFSILCSPPFNNRRVCSEDAFVGQNVGIGLSYPMSILKEHQDLLAAFKTLVRSFGHFEITN